MIIEHHQSLLLDDLKPLFTNSGLVQLLSTIMNLTPSAYLLAIFTGHNKQAMINYHQQSSNYLYFRGYFDQQSQHQKIHGSAVFSCVSSCTTPTVPQRSPRGGASFFGHRPVQSQKLLTGFMAIPGNPGYKLLTMVN